MVGPFEEEKGRKGIVFGRQGMEMDGIFEFQETKAKK